jgi:hypothetical protein
MVVYYRDGIDNGPIDCTLVGLSPIYGLWQVRQLCLMRQQRMRVAVRVETDWCAISWTSRVPTSKCLTAEQSAKSCRSAEQWRVRGRRRSFRWNIPARRSLDDKVRSLMSLWIQLRQNITNNS